MLEQVKRAHEGLRSKLYPLIQWVWEKVISTAMLPGGALSQYATVEDWNVIDFVTDPDPSADAGRDHKAQMERMGENLITPDDLVELLTGNDGRRTREAAVLQKLELIEFAIEAAKERGIPASIATVIALGQRTSQMSNSMLTTLSPQSLAGDLAEMDQAEDPAEDAAEAEDDDMA
jgi:hypothetical protein